MISKRIVIRTNTANTTHIIQSGPFVMSFSSILILLSPNKYSIFLVAYYNRFPLALLNISSPSNDNLILIRWAEIFTSLSL